MPIIKKNIGHKWGTKLWRFSCKICKKERKENFLYFTLKRGSKLTHHFPTSIIQNVSDEGRKHIPTISAGKQVPNPVRYLVNQHMSRIVQCSQQFLSHCLCTSGLPGVGDSLLRVHVYLRKELLPRAMFTSL